MGVMVSKLEVGLTLPAVYSGPCERSGADDEGLIKTFRSGPILEEFWPFTRSCATATEHLVGDGENVSPRKDLGGVVNAGLDTAVPAGEDKSGIDSSASAALSLGFIGDNVSTSIA